MTEPLSALPSYRIRVDRRSYDTHIIIPNLILPQFKALMARALNTFDAALPQFKELCDVLEIGEMKQDYYSQSAHIPIRSDLPKKT